MLASHQQPVRAAAREPQPAAPRFVGLSGGDSAPRDSDAPPVAPPALPRYAFSSRTFSIQYPSTGRPGAELWGTLDGGRSWTLYAVDADAKSPLDAKVAGPGVYGFRIAIPPTNGLSAPAPRSGQPPEFWVEVRDAAGR
jgi:hypothetical protein